MKNKKTTFICLLVTGLSIIFMNAAIANKPDLKVKITAEISSIKVKHHGKNITIQRNQNPNNRIVEALSLTSRACPPHCIQPIKIKGVETIGELELLSYLKKVSNGASSILVIDTRSSAMAAQGTIPGSININGNRLIASRGANSIEIEEILTQQFGAQENSGTWNFKHAKTLVLYCYGIWCGQAPLTINALISLGYPKHKLKWYRGGMQAWESLGLTTVRTK